MENKHNDEDIKHQPPSFRRVCLPLRQISITIFEREGKDLIRLALNNGRRQ